MSKNERRRYYSRARLERIARYLVRINARGPQAGLLLSLQLGLMGPMCREDYAMLTLRCKVLGLIGTEI